MSSGAYAPRWRRALHRVPGLFSRCPAGNMHWRWDRKCYCCVGWNGLGTFTRLRQGWTPDPRPGDPTPMTEGA